MLAQDLCEAIGAPDTVEAKAAAFAVAELINQVRAALAPKKKR